MGDIPQFGKKRGGGGKFLKGGLRNFPLFLGGFLEEGVSERVLGAKQGQGWGQPLAGLEFGTFWGTKVRAVFFWSFPQEGGSFCHFFLKRGLFGWVSTTVFLKNRGCVKTFPSVFCLEHLGVCGNLFFSPGSVGNRGFYPFYLGGVG